MPIPIDFSKLGPEDVLDIAAFIEDEAEARYEQFADLLERRGERAAAGFFRSMAQLEGAHGAQVKRRRSREYRQLPAHLRDVAVWDVEGPELDHDVTSLSVGEALEIALRSERQARDFFAEASEHLAGDAVSAVLADLRRDEEGHIRLLEEQRQRLASSL